MVAEGRNPRRRGNPRFEKIVCGGKRKKERVIGCEREWGFCMRSLGVLFLHAKKERVIGCCIFYFSK